MKLIIGLSYAPDDNPKYDHYRNAIRNAARTLEYELEMVDLSKNSQRIKEIDGIIFTGGADIQPARYGKQSEERLCGEIDEARDQAEFELADKAEQEAIPTLGICRGLQLLNVHRGGTLLTDIETFGGRNHKRTSNDEDSRHHVTIAAGTYLAKILSKREGEINSAHHQAIERAGDGLAISARATEDGTVEAIEWTDATGKPFFLGVQWHPERMDYDEQFAGRLFETFLLEAAAHKSLKERVTALYIERRELQAEPTQNGYSKHP
ncbi:MAG TPA: gamma-glutamyl-gamma-aminobutyrate hydrolase family protein [Candidatus Kapabacteria bacterium]|jgi:putative glutamine amidotransferase|nr:gamma-glutamyl-gamma-aminobutyrate hydrolase family protein [Candidatus Kapabacteria bacterium]